MLKKPSDYPQLSVRVSATDKARIFELVNELVASSNQAQNENDKVIRKNDVIVDALYLGLLTLKKNGHKPL